MAKRVVRREWTAQDERALKKHSKAKTPVSAISKALKRTPERLDRKLAISEFRSVTVSAQRSELGEANFSEPFASH